MAFEIENQLPLDDGLNAYRIQEAVLHKLQKDGFAIPQPPTWQPTGGQFVQYQGELPQDLTAMTDQQLGQYLSLVSGWLAFVGAQMAVARMEKMVAKNQLEFTEATIRLSCKRDEEGKKRTTQERDDMVHCDRRFVEANRTYIYLDAFHALVEVIFKAAEQSFAAISRRITQRGQEIDRGSRGNAVQNHHAPGTPLMPGRRS
jgi:hypothetical protein